METKKKDCIYVLVTIFSIKVVTSAFSYLRFSLDQSILEF